ncbi:MAG: MBL fold metallo-hydrolase [Promethearchaeota archaeon]
MLLESEKGGAAVLLDYGVKMEKKEDNFPLHISARDVDAILLTHAHIDHSGGIPLFYVSNSPPVFATQLTLEITKILVRDMINISGSRLPFELPELKKMLLGARPVEYESRVRVAKDTYATFYNGGHIPGSAQILVEMDGKRILYTGDVNVNASQLVAPMHQKFPAVDCVITESSYAMANHLPREVIEETFVERVTDVISNGGQVLVPAFGVARSQEVVCVLEKYRVKAPIFLDGMARSVAKLFARYPLYFRDYKTMSRAFKRATFIGERKRAIEDRRNAVKRERAIIVAPSGMMKGGTVRYYAKRILPDPRSGVFLVSYQVEGMPGRVLLEENKYVDEENGRKENVEVMANVDFFDFSAHSGRDQLMAFATGLNYRNHPTAFCIHGEEVACTTFARRLSNQHDFDAFAPEAGDSFLL